MFAPGTGGLVLLAVSALLVVAALVSPPGRRAAAAAIGSVGRWPALIRSELRGDAPLDDRGHRDDTTPELPAVRDEPPRPTRVFPQVELPDR
ncbi:hypothetical protein H7X46_03390 [Pseudonocardia sp. C8]|uniref:hypothetical protein n=1 Tax=Pseudonocardia sp. C8 TaxID=2762759 RepID=UPI0016432186|nr:hypothetical protein [Pseudonocardia sp. C8]MBC3190105.1 hypothetical protein [Pseudonocardia sp. C8]